MWKEANECINRLTSDRLVEGQVPGDQEGARRNNARGEVIRHWLVGLVDNRSYYWEVASLRLALDFDQGLADAVLALAQRVFDLQTELSIGQGGVHEDLRQHFGNKEHFDELG